MGLLIEQMQIRDLVFPEAVVTKGAQEIRNKQASKQNKNPISLNCHLNLSL